MTYNSLEEAQKKLYQGSITITDRREPIEETLGMTLSEDIIAKVTQPPFRRSAMDGYALRYEDITGITDKSPKTFPVIGCIYAGDNGEIDLPKGSAVRIMTGAPIPDNADVIIPQEMTDYGEDQVTIYHSLPQNANCVPRGEDFNEGDILAKKGQKIDAYTIAASVAGGIREAKVKRPIRAVVITTGTELADSDQPLKNGQIYNSNRAFFQNRLKEKGCIVAATLQVGDDVDTITKEIKTAMDEHQADLIITTGGVSVGKHDYLPDVIADIGADILFQGIAIKPGSPTMAARLKDTTILCLSGNPYSAIAMFEMLYPYYEQKAYGRVKNTLFPMEMPTVNGYPKASKKRRIVRGILESGGVYIPRDQKNGQLHGGIGSNCLVDIPAGTPMIHPGEQITVWMI